MSVDNKILENQIVGQDSSSIDPSGKLPSQAETNPTENCKAVSLRSGKCLRNPLHRSSERLKDGGESNEIIDPTHESSSKEIEKQVTKPYVPSLPFPHRLAKAKFDT